MQLQSYSVMWKVYKAWFWAPFDEEQANMTPVD